MLAVGEQLWDEVPEILRRVACPFGGGVGGTHEDLCGVFSGAVILAGARYGRVSPEKDDKPLYEAVADLRERFGTLFGYVRCDNVRLSQPDVPKRCRTVVVDGARLVMEWFEAVEQSDLG